MHGLEDGDTVVFKSIKGMKKLDENDDGSVQIDTTDKP